MREEREELAETCVRHDVNEKTDEPEHRNFFEDSVHQRDHIFFVLDVIPRILINIQCFSPGEHNIRNLLRSKLSVCASISTSISQTSEIMSLKSKIRRLNHELDNLRNQSIDDDIDIKDEISIEEDL